jgi:hypothetical protein
VRSVESWHRRHRTAASTEDCFECGKHRAKCASKLVFSTYEDAAEAALAANIEGNWDRPLYAYECCWCLRFHMATARGASKRRKARKQQVREALRTAATTSAERDRQKTSELRRD